MKTNRILIALVLISSLLLAGCNSKLKVGTLKTETQSVELGDAKSVNVEIYFGAGDLQVDGGTEKLLEASFTYNVAQIKPEVEYADGTLVVRQPEVKGIPTLGDITDFRNVWDLRLNNQAPMHLSVNLGAGNSDLHLAGLWLTGLDVSLGAGISTVDLSGDWGRDLNISIDSGAADITLLLPKDIGVRVEVDAGPTAIIAPGLTKDGNVYTNDAYRGSEVTLQIKMEAGIGKITLEEEDQTQGDTPTGMISGWVWHDQCDSGKDGQPAPATTPPGCVNEVSPIGPYHADGTMAINEPLIDGVVVTIGEGACPSTGLAEISTIITDLSFGFSGLKAGIYCVSIDPQREPNFSILRPGMWTFPENTQDIISTTVDLTSGGYKGMVNFGWDYQFQP